MLELYWKNTIILMSIVPQLYSRYPCFHSGSRNKMQIISSFYFTLGYCVFFNFLFQSSMVSAWNRRKICINWHVMLFYALWFCLYCMYFFKRFWGRPQKYRSACERGRTCTFTGYSGMAGWFVMTCVNEAPNKTLVGLWLYSLFCNCEPSVVCDRC